MVILIMFYCLAKAFVFNPPYLTPTGLNLEQVDTLWDCLALDKDCSDDCLSWFLNQAKSKDHHAMGLETFKHIFLEKVSLVCNTPGDD